MKYYTLKGADFEITLEPIFGHYLGKWSGKIFRNGVGWISDADLEDGWPRYFFSLTAGQIEIAYWAKARGLKIEDGWDEKDIE